MAVVMVVVVLKHSFIHRTILSGSSLMAKQIENGKNVTMCLFGLKNAHNNVVFDSSSYSSYALRIEKCARPKEQHTLLSEQCETSTQWTSEKERDRRMNNEKENQTSAIKEKKIKTTISYIATTRSFVRSSSRSLLVWLSSAQLGLPWRLIKLRIWYWRPREM